MTGFSIMTVCSGNICRSPVAEQLLRAALADVPGVTVSSAGTIAMLGDAMPEQAAAMSRRAGGVPDAHEPRELSERAVSTADLVFAMAREHRRDAVSLWPKASRYTFTIREFARLSEGLSEWDLLEIAKLPDSAIGDRLTAMVELIASRRGAVDPPENPDDDDVVDPYRQSDAVYALTEAQLLPAVTQAVRTLRLAVDARTR